MCRVRTSRAIVQPIAVLGSFHQFVERLLGIRVGETQVVRGKAFVQGVVDRVGEPELTRLLDLPGSMPTPNEIEAPGLWIARVSDD